MGESREINFKRIILFPSFPSSTKQLVYEATKSVAGRALIEPEGSVSVVVEG